MVPDDVSPPQLCSLNAKSLRDHNTEIGEIASMDDCSTSDTTEELLGELGLSKDGYHGTGIGATNVTNATTSLDSNMSGNDTESVPVDKSPTASLTVQEAPPVKTKQQDTVKTGQDTTTSPNELNKTEVEPKLQTSVTKPKITAESTTTGEAQHPNKLDLLTKIKRESKQDVITEGVSEPDEVNHELNTQLTFHQLQEQIEQLQCKVEVQNLVKTELTCGDVKDLIKSEQVKFALPTNDIISVSSDCDSTGKEVKNSPQLEPVDSSNESSQPVMSLRKRKRPNLITSETDSDDNIPLSSLRDKIRKTSEVASQDTKPKKKKPKRACRNFVTKPPPSQSNKPIINRGNVESSSPER